MKQTATPPNPVNLAFAEKLYEDFLRDPASVPRDWQDYFKEIANGELQSHDQRFGPAFRPSSIFNPRGGGAQPAALETRDTLCLQDRIALLIRCYRVLGHRLAQVDPLGRVPPTPPELEPRFYGFTDADMDLPVHTETFQFEGPLMLGELI